MDAQELIQNPELILDFMKSKGYPVFHKSNIFRRDIEYAIRDYSRTKTRKDLPTLKLGSLNINAVRSVPEQFITAMEQAKAPENFRRIPLILC